MVLSEIEDVEFALGVVSAFLNKLKNAQEVTGEEQATDKEIKDDQVSTRRDLKEIIEWAMKKEKKILYSIEFSSLPYKFQKDASRTRKAIELGVAEGFMAPTKDLNYRGQPRSWVLTQQEKEIEENESKIDFRGLFSKWMGSVVVDLKITLHGRDIVIPHGIELNTREGLVKFKTEDDFHCMTILYGAFFEFCTTQNYGLGGHPTDIEKLRYRASLIEILESKTENREDYKIFVTFMEETGGVKIEKVEGYDMACLEIEKLKRRLRFQF